MEDINLGIIIAQLINFGIIFFIFYYFLGDKIVKIIEERKQKLLNLDSLDILIKEKLEKAEKEAQEIILKAKQEALDMQKNTEELIKKETKIKLEEAQMKADALVNSALRDIEKERLSMVNYLKQKVIDISLQINSKILTDSSKNKEFIQKEINSINL